METESVRQPGNTETFSALPPRQQITQKFPIVGEREPAPMALDLQNWRLTISGAVEQPQTWTYDALLQLPQVEVVHDIHCVTRWSRLGCRWRGVSFATLAAEVKPVAKAHFVQFVAYSSRQHDSSLPLDVCLDGGVLLAWEMDGEPLSVPHGYPLRVVAPSRYFYKSVKWVRQIRFLSTDVLGYWERGGYHNNGDFWQEERYVSGNLSMFHVKRLRQNANFAPYRRQVLLSLDLSHANFAGAQMKQVQLKHCTLAGSNLQGADLRDANLTNTDLQGANLRGADLTGADLEGALFMGADLRDCSMRQARLAAAEFCRVGLPAAQVQGLDLGGATVDDLLETQYQFLRQQNVLPGEIRGKKTDMATKKLAIKTYGCQMNVYDSERIVGLLQQADYELTDDVQQAHLVLLNTCSVREKADQKFYSELGRLKRIKQQRNDMLIGVCGCIPQRARGEILKRAPYVDLVFGTLNVSRVLELVRQMEESDGPVMEITDKVLDDDLGALPVTRDSHVTAFVSVMHGCNKRCSFCVVPNTRGPQVSRPMPVILDEIRNLARAGYKEVTLLGQNVDAYGVDVRPRSVDFADLLEAVNAIEGIERIRFVTSHPLDFAPRLIDAMASLDKVCESLHLPFQAGADRILKLMRRGYTAANYRDLISRIREAVPDIALTTDVIVGFPGETEAEFLETRRMLEWVRYDSIFLFHYSDRPDTVAPGMPEQIPHEVKQRRFDGLINMQKRISLAANLPYEGQTFEVLVEGPSKKNSDKLTGRTRTNKIVNFSGDDALIGTLVPVHITHAGLYALDGELAAVATLPPVLIS